MSPRHCFCLSWLLCLLLLVGRLSAGASAAPSTRLPPSEQPQAESSAPAQQASAQASSTSGCDTAWTVVAAQMVSYESPGLNRLNAVSALASNAVWAVGTYPYRNHQQPLVQRWDGTRWWVDQTPTSDTRDTQLHGVHAISPTNVWAVGTARLGSSASNGVVLHWNGSSWQNVSIPGLSTTASAIKAIAATSASDLWLLAEQNGSSMIVRGNGTSWTQMPLNPPGTRHTFNSIAALAPNDVWIGGWYDTSGIGIPLLMHWNGSTWQVTPSPVENGFVYDLAAVAANDVWAVGEASYKTMTLHWDGMAWQSVAAPNPEYGSHVLAGVDMVSPTDGWAVGHASYRPISLHWDGSTWQAVPVKGHWLTDVSAVSESDVWAVGFAQSVQQTLIERYHPVLTATPSTLHEADGIGQIPLKLTSLVVSDVTARYAITGQTATSGSDFVAAEGMVTIPACSSSATIPVTLLDDPTWEVAERLTVSITGTGGISPPAGTALPVIISDPDDAPHRAALPSMLKPPRASGRIAFASNSYVANYEIYVMEADGSQRQRLTNHPAQDQRPAWSPDGRQIAFQSDRDGTPDIYVMNADGTNVRRLTTHSAWDMAPSWSPDGQQIAFMSDRDGGTYLYLMYADGSNQRRLTPLVMSNPQDAWPSWSPDGRRLAFTSMRNSRRELFLINADGTQLTSILSTQRDLMTPLWSPDGQRIALAVGAYPFLKLMSIRPDGSSLTELNWHFDTGWHPTWNPSGTQMAFTNGYNIFVMGFDHTQPQQLTEVGENIDPAWFGQ